MSNETWWYVARAGGIVAWVLAGVSVLWGVFMSGALSRGRISRQRLLDLHRFVAGLTVVFTVLHGLGLYAHQFQNVQFGLRELLVPNAAAYRPTAVAYGIVAFYLLIAVEITSLLRSRLSPKLWRGVHYASFVVFLLGSLHALRAGTDVDPDKPVVWWSAALLAAAVFGMGLTRGMAAFRAADRETAAAPLSTPSDDTKWDRPLALPTEGRPSLEVLQRTHERLAQLDLGSYPQVELPPEGLTTRPPVPDTPARLDVPSLSSMAGLAPSTFEVPLVEEVPDLELEADAEVPADTPSWQGPFEYLPFAPDAPAHLAPVVEAPPAYEPPVYEAPPAYEPPVYEAPPAYEPLPVYQAPVFAEPAPPPPPVFEEPPPLPQPAAYQPLPTMAPAAVAPQPPFQAAPPPVAFAEEVASPRRDPLAPLPSRTPRRFEATTAPSRLPGEWSPLAPAAVAAEARPAGPPPPPEPDPATGVVDPSAYRTWLREWLAFAETYDG